MRRWLIAAMLVGTAAGGFDQAAGSTGALSLSVIATALSMFALWCAFRAGQLAK